MEASLLTVANLASACNADFQVLRQKPMDTGVIAQVLLRRKVEEDDFLEVRYVVVCVGLVSVCVVVFVDGVWDGGDGCVGLQMHVTANY